jgi:D-xylonolactonase
MPDARVSTALDLTLQLGEASIWHEDEQVLYFADIDGQELHRYDPVSGAHDIVLRGETVAGITVQADGTLLLFQAAGRISRFAGGRTTPIRPDIAEDSGTRFNDVVTDPEGRVYCGTMPTDDRAGRLYRLDHDGSIREVIPDAGVSNGTDFSPDGRWMYHTNTSRRSITRYAWDRATGEITDGVALVGPDPEAPDGPDGMTLDADGSLWSARWGGSRIDHYAPDGQILGSIPIPAKNVSSIAFAGPDYRTAFVTTAGGDDRGSNGPLAGSLFRVEPGVTGRPPFRSRILLG